MLFCTSPIINEMTKIQLKIQKTPSLFQQNLTLFTEMKIFTFFIDGHAQLFFFSVIVEESKTKLNKSPQMILDFG